MHGSLEGIRRHGVLGLVSIIANSVIFNFVKCGMFVILVAGVKQMGAVF
jgi:hypothetical protein